jgi:hypothetical protein
MKGKYEGTVAIGVSIVRSTHFVSKLEVYIVSKVVTHNIHFEFLFKSHMV